MEGLEIRVSVGAPVVLGGSPHGPCLDQVLAALAARRDGATYPPLPDTWRKTVPVPGIQLRDGVPLASALWPVGAYVWDQCVLPRKPDFDALIPWSRPLAWRSDFGPYLSRATTLRVVTATTWVWWCVGDRDVVEDMLGDLLSVGAKRGAGFGAVTRTEIRPAPPENGVLFQGRRLTRPVPLRLLAAWSIDADRLDPGTFAVAPAPGRGGVPAWYTPALEPCMVPVLGQDDRL